MAKKNVGEQYTPEQLERLEQVRAEVYEDVYEGFPQELIEHLQKDEKVQTSIGYAEGCRDMAQKAIEKRKNAYRTCSLIIQAVRIYENDEAQKLTQLIRDRDALREELSQNKTVVEGTSIGKPHPNSDLWKTLDRLDKEIAQARKDISDSVAIFRGFNNADEAFSIKNAEEALYNSNKTK
jgi:hypothetical protein